MSAFLKRLFRGNEDKYPHKLEEKFSRILDRLVELWGKEGFDAYISELMIDDKGDRQGFPPEIVSELFVLSMVHDEYLVAMKGRETDPWENQEIREQLEADHVEFSPKGFFGAVDAGNVNAIKLFVLAGVDLETLNSAGWTVLMVSSFMGSEEAAEILINAGANVNVRDNRGYGPLHWAAYKGYLRICQMLINKGAYVNAPSEKGITPLLQAAACGHREIVELLLTKKALPNEGDHEGWTPLHKAVANHRKDVVLVLMRSGANPELRHNTGLTPVDIANQKNYKDIVPILTRNSHS